MGRSVSNILTDEIPLLQLYRPRSGSQHSERSNFWLWHEVELCANRPKHHDSTLSVNEPTKVIILNWVATILAYAHWISGTLVFSSTLFIGTLDAFGVIARYAVSALLCRAIMLMELSGLRSLETEEEDEKSPVHVRVRPDQHTG